MLGGEFEIPGGKTFILLVIMNLGRRLNPFYIRRYRNAIDLYPEFVYGSVANWKRSG